MVQDFKPRNQILDIAKGISILLMTISHLELFKHNNSIMCMNDNVFVIFKMPLFIIISGILFSTKYNYKEFIKHKSDGLLKPTLSIFGFSILIFLAVKIFIKHNFTFDFVPAALGTFYPLWFIIILFLGQLVLYPIVKKALSFDNNFIYMSILLIFSYFLFKEKIEWSVFKVHEIFIFFIYLFIGYLIKVFDLLNKLISCKIMVLSTTIFIFLVYFSKWNTFVDLFNGNIGDIIPVLFSSFMGVIMVLNFSNILNKTKWLKYILIECSKASYFILVFHILISDLLIGKMFKLFDLQQLVLIDALNFIITIVLCIALYYGLKKVPIINKLLYPLKALK